MSFMGYFILLVLSVLLLIVACVVIADIVGTTLRLKRQRDIKKRWYD